MGFALMLLGLLFILTAMWMPLGCILSFLLIPAPSDKEVRGDARVNESVVSDKKGALCEIVEE